ncbi:MAG TPA: MFS transporter [Ktedonobacterales bacterium]|nr:MFS transporter [Ktedonobacterales bacterium]
MAQGTRLDTSETKRPQGGPSPAKPDPRRWWALAATSFGLFMALLDVTIVNVALPTIGDDVKASFSDLQWVINAYALSLAVLLVTAGRLGDIFGRKRLFMLGLGLFALGSLICGLSGNFSIGAFSHIQVLIAARAFQGIGGAIMLPLALAIIAATFTGRERATAIGIYGGVSGLAVAVGPVIGGALVSSFGWQSIFFVNVPVGVIAVAMVAWAVSESFDRTAPRTVDIFGLITLTISLFCLVLALIQGNDPDKGWTSPYILALFAVSAVALIIFIAGELRLKSPMVDPRLFANASFSGAAIVAFALSGGLYALFFFLTLYFQNFLGYSALDTGLRFLSLSGLTLVVAPLAGVLTNRLGPKLIMSVGMALAVAAVLLMTGITPADTQSDWVRLLPAFVLGGIASGMVSPLISNVAVSTVHYDRAGMASGISGVCRQIGTAFGIAFLGALLTNQYDSAIQSGIGKLAVPHVPPGTQHGILQGIISSLQNAGTFAGSTGLRYNVPPQYASFTHVALFPQVAIVVQHAYIGATVDAFRWAAALLALGLLAALLLVKRADMRRQDAPSGAEM